MVTLATEPSLEPRAPFLWLYLTPPYQKPRNRSLCGSRPFSQAREERREEQTCTTPDFVCHKVRECLFHSASSHHDLPPPQEGRRTGARCLRSPGGPGTRGLSRSIGPSSADRGNGSSPSASPSHSNRTTRPSGPRGEVRRPQVLSHSLGRTGKTCGKKRREVSPPTSSGVFPRTKKVETVIKL